MLVKLSDQDFIISIDTDTVAALIDDYCVMLNTKGAMHYPAAWEFLCRLNEIYWYEHGSSITPSIEEYVRLEEEEA